MTATLAEHARTLPRRIPRPATEPPYDNEHGSSVVGSAGGAIQGALALDLRRQERELPERVTARRSSSRHLEPVSDPCPDDDEDAFFARQRTPRAALPDPKLFCGRYVQALVEVLSGERSLAQLMRWTNEDVYADLRHRVRLLNQAGQGNSADPKSGFRGRPGRPGQPRRMARAMVRSVHVQEPRDGIAEVCVHVRHGGKSRAVAVRLEGLDGIWRCTALQLG